MLPRPGQVNAASRARNSSGGSYSKMYSGGGGGGATLVAASATAVDSMLSMKDVQRCFEKERRAFIRDLESLRQQLVKKDQTAAKAATVASQHAVQLKKEIASLQAALTASERESLKHQEQFRHTSLLLETALDQHQADQAKLTELSETVRTMERKHGDALALVRKDAASNANSTHEERKALRARVEQLRSKLESERKEWQALQKPLKEELDKTKARLTVQDKELHESRYREQASFQLKEKMQSEVVKYKRKVADLSTALQEALSGKSEMKGEHQLTVRKMKEKWREVLAAYALAKEQLQMLQEDYSGFFQSRELIVEQSDRVYESMNVMMTRHEQALKEKENEYWDLEKRFKRNSATCTMCLKTPEQRQEDVETKMGAVREQTRLQVVQEMELERWDRFQDVNAKYMDVSKQLQLSMRDCDQLQTELKGFCGKYEDLHVKEKKLVDILSRAEKRIQELERIASEEAQRSEDAKRQIQEMMDNLSKMTTVTADQSRQLQELEVGRRQELDRSKDAINALEAEKQRLTCEKEALQLQFDHHMEEFDQLKSDKTKQWNDIMSAQLSANLLIEEQAHTIDNLLKSRYVSPSKAGQALDASYSTESRSSPVNNSAESATEMVLRRECDHLRDELTKTSASFAHTKESLQSEYERKVVELMRELAGLQRERDKLKRRLHDQAVTIHELTLQDDDAEEEEEEEVGRGCDSTNGEQLLYEDAAAANETRRKRRSSGLMGQRHGHNTNDWTPKRKPCKVQPPVPVRIRRGRSSVNFKNTSQDLSAIRAESDDDTMAPVSFLSATLT